MKNLKQRRIVSILLAGIMLLSFAACNRSIGTTVEPSEYGEIYQKLQSLTNSPDESERGIFGSIGAWAKSFNRNEMNAANPTAEAGIVQDSDGDDGALPNSADTNGSLAQNPDFSDTNNQVEGVQESDIVKTDGINIYIAHSGWYFNDESDDSYDQGDRDYGDRSKFGKISVIKTDNGNMEKIASIELKDSAPNQMLLYEGKLIIIWNKIPDNEVPEVNTTIRCYGTPLDCETIVEVYNTKNGFDKPVSTYSQKGGFCSARMINNNIYLITTFYPQITKNFEQGDIDCYIPSYTVNENTEKQSEKCYIEPKCIKVPETIQSAQYTVIGGLDVNKPDIAVSTAANLDCAGTVYSTLENIYITRAGYNSGNRDVSTAIDRFSLDKGSVEFKATGKVEGEINNQFQLDEYKGVLRVVSQSRNPQGGSLYTINASDMKVLAQIHKIGEGESVQSVRFMGDIGYIVTFRQTDPLFSFDLSNPKKPVQLDELKIPGFSRYLHSWSDGLLLGMGVDANENGGRTGLKLSMFDVSDNEDLTERHVKIISPKFSDQRGYVSSPVESDHKAALVSPGKNIIGFPYYFYGDSSSEAAVYAIFSYGGDGFRLIGEIKYIQDSYNEAFCEFLRGLYIDDYIYAVADGIIMSAKLTPAGIDDIKSLTL